MCRQEGESETSYCGIYSELLGVIGKENVEKIHETFRGQQITFPIHLRTIEYVVQLTNDPSWTLKKLASEYGYSERHISRKKKQLEKGRITINEKR